MVRSAHPTEYRVSGVNISLYDAPQGRSYEQRQESDTVLEGHVSGRVQPGSGTGQLAGFEDKRRKGRESAHETDKYDHAGLGGYLPPLFEKP